MPGAQSWWRAGGPVSFVDPTTLAARARARALRDATSDQTWRPAEFKHISQRMLTMTREKPVQP